MPRRSSGSRLALYAVAGLLVVAAVALRWAMREPVARPVPSPHVAAARPSAGTVSPAPGALEASNAPATDDALPVPPAADPLADGEEWDGSWESVDLEEIRKALPDNIYWKMGAPTTDPEVLRQREEEHDRWNTEYGKVLSNTATDEEIDAYYAERQRVSEDYLEFIVYLMTHYGDQVPKRDAGAFKLAGEMHHARLEEIPRQIAEAHARREAHEKARQAWLEEQKKFEGDNGAGNE